MDAVLIHGPLYPTFRVNLRRESALLVTLPQETPKESLGTRVRTFAVGLFVHIKRFFESLKDAGKYLFIYALLGVRIAAGFPAEIMFKIFLVSVTTFWSIVTVGIFIFRPPNVRSDPKNTTSPVVSTQELAEYVKGSPLDLSHLRVISTKVDMSGVPESVKLQDLKPLLEDVSIDPANKHLPGYITAPIWVDAMTQRSFTMSKEELMHSMNELIDNIEQKKPWTGAPPSADKEAVNHFYQKLSDLIRFSLHKVKGNLETFLQTECSGVIPIEPTENSSVEEKALFKKYCDFLEERNRFLIDTAMTGKYCATRAIGEALDSYCRITGESNSEVGSLGDRIAHMLANKRLEIMRADLAAVYRNDNHTTHYFAAYMTQLGAVLGLPGSEGMSEHLVKINTKKMLLRFIPQYMEGMNQVILDKYRTCEEFRELVMAWLKDQVGTWNQEKYEKAYANIKLEKIMASPEITQHAKQRGGKIREWLEKLREGEEFKELIEQQDESFNEKDILSQLMNLPKTKEWLEKQEDFQPFALLNKGLELLAEQHIQLPSTQSFQELLNFLVSQKKFRDHLLKTLPINHCTSIQELRTKEKQAIDAWKKSFSNIKELQMQWHNPQQMLNLLRRLISRHITLSWSQEIAHPELIPLLKISAAGKSYDHELTLLTKRLEAREQVEHLSKQLMDELEMPIAKEMQERFVNAILAKDKASLQQMIQSQVKEACKTEFLHAMMSESLSEGREGAALSKDIVRWLLISFGVLTY